MSRPALRLAPASLCPERQALADAIAEAGPLRAAADEARARAEAARGVLAAARDAVPAAERAAEEAKARLIDNPAEPRADLRAKRQAVTDAADDLAIAREVSARADAAEEDAKRSARYAAEKVEAAASVVLAGAFPVVMEAAERAARAAAALAFAAQWVGGNGNAFDGEAFRLKVRADALNPRFAFGSDGNAALAAQHQAQAPWLAARAALLTDPAAPLPVVP